jgi:hypothetical protein
MKKIDNLVSIRLDGVVVITHRQYNTLKKDSRSYDVTSKSSRTTRRSAVVQLRFTRARASSDSREKKYA